MSSAASCSQMKFGAADHLRRAIAQVRDSVAPALMASRMTSAAAAVWPMARGCHSGAGIDERQAPGTSGASDTSRMSPLAASCAV